MLTSFLISKFRYELVTAARRELKKLEGLVFFLMLSFSFFTGHEITQLAQQTPPLAY